MRKYGAWGARRLAGSYGMVARPKGKWFNSGVIGSRTVRNE